MILVEAAPDLAQLDVVLGRHAPRQLDQPLEVGPGHGVLGARRLHALEAVELLARDLLGLLGQLGLDDLLGELVEVAGAVVELTQLLLDGLELLAQHVLALVAAHLLLDLGVDALLDLEDLELARQELQHLAGPGLEVERLEHVLLLGHLELEVRRHEVGQVTGLGHAVDQGAGLLGQLGHELDHALGDVLEVHHQRVELDVGRGRVGHGLDLGRQERLGALERGRLEARHALQDHREVVLGQLDDLEDAGGAPDRVQVAGLWVLGAGVLLGQDADDRALLGDGVLDEPDRLATADVDRDDRPGKEHRVSQWEDRELIRDLDRRVSPGLGLRHDRKLAMENHERQGNLPAMTGTFRVNAAA